MDISHLSPEDKDKVRGSAVSPGRGDAAPRKPEPIEISTKGVWLAAVGILVVLGLAVAAFLAR